MIALHEKNTNLSNVYRYAFMSIMADYACISLFTDKIQYLVSNAEYLKLLLIFKVISVFLRIPILFFADKVAEKHSGAVIGVMMTVGSCLLPFKFGAVIKVLGLALGNAVLHAFAEASVLSRSEFRAKDIGVYSAGSVLGIALAIFNPTFIKPACTLLMIVATPYDKYTELDSVTKKKTVPQIKYSPVVVISLLTSVLLLTASLLSMSFSFSSPDKTALLTAAAVSAGCFAGGYVFDKLSFIPSPAVSFIGAALLCLKNGSVAFVLVGLFLIGSVVPTLIQYVFTVIPRWRFVSLSLITVFAFFATQIVKKLSLSDSFAYVLLILSVFISAASIVISALMLKYFKKTDTD